MEEKRKILQSIKNGLGAKRIKPEKHEALNKAIRKWLLILLIETVLVNRSLPKKKTFEFANELNFEGFRPSEIWLKNEKINVLRFGNF